MKQWRSLACGAYLAIDIFGASAATAAEPKAELTVAAAANFAPLLPALTETFHRQTGIQLQIASGSTGTLYAQIQRGAPFALLLAADRESAQAIAASPRGLPQSLSEIACGELVLWSKHTAIADGAHWLRQHPRAKIALANVQTAPYGRAAAETLNKLNWRGARIQAENAAQAYQFGASGAVDAAFIAKSQYIAAKLQGGWLVPSNFHTALSHSAVISRNVDAAAQRRAQQLLDFLLSEGGQTLLQQAGYRRCAAQPAGKQTTVSDAEHALR